MPRKPASTRPEPAIERLDYQATFSTPHGRRVLAHMLFDLGFFAQATTPEEAALRNYATTLLGRVGAITPANIRAVTDSLVNVASTTQQKEDNE